MKQQVKQRVEQQMKQQYHKQAREQKSETRLAKREIGEKNARDPILMSSLETESGSQSHHGPPEAGMSTT